MHMAGGILVYDAPGFFGQAWWVAPLFAGAAVLLVDGHRLFNATAPRLRPAAVALRAGAFIACYALTAFSPLPALLLGTLLGAAFLVWAVRAQETLGFFVYAGACAAVGTLFEMGLAAAGAFRYTHPDLASVPSWLPALYLWAAVCGGGLARARR
jgi:hypothetical protein